MLLLFRKKCFKMNMFFYALEATVSLVENSNFEKNVWQV